MISVRGVMALCLVLTFSSQTYAGDNSGPGYLQEVVAKEQNGVADNEQVDPLASKAGWPGEWSNIFSLRGALSAICSYNDLDDDNSSLSLRYVPELKLSAPLNDTLTFYADAALDANAVWFFDSDHDSDKDSRVDLYRFSGKIATNQLEVRAGLQEINFGPARILRSLMWFDQIDPFDPLERTDGVKAFLLRYFFLNNANIWLWGLYDNDDLKGMEFVKSKEHNIEFGGRCQIPMPSGEIAISYDQRHLDPDDWLAKKSTVLDEGIENKIALDAFWDIKIGLWFELIGSETRFNLIRNVSGNSETGEFYQAMGTVGSDYTFQNGIHILGEFFQQAMGDKWGEFDTNSRIGALSADYNLNNIDRVIITAINDLTSDDLKGVFQWQRTYDDWQFDLNIFGSTCNDDQNEISAAAGSGFLALITYNH